DRQVRERLLDAAGTTTTARMEALHDDRLADIGLGDDECIDIEVMIVLGIGNSRLQRLLDGAGNALAREFEIVQRRLHLLAADERGNQVQLLRADPYRTRDGTSLVISKPARSFGLAHCYFLFAFLSAPWP